jgi:Ser/Thr protein kinase RdoA (MazF antagonist)
MEVIMEKQIHSIFNDEILMKAAEFYDMDDESLKKIGGFENYVYGYSLKGKEYILRITHSSHRTVGMMNAELHWVNYLSHMGADVSQPIASKGGLLVEKIPSGPDDYFLTSAFEKAPGNHVRQQDKTNALYEEWGRCIGKLHQLTKTYEPDKTYPLRPSWYEDPIFYKAKEYLLTEDYFIADKLFQLTESIKKLPKDQDSYGLIHTDVHSGNFFIDNGKITIFDFDDSSYQYFISDIAIALFYTMLNIEDVKERTAHSYNFLKQFLKGYRKENTLADFWLDTLPDFLKLRELELCVVIYRSCDMNNPDPWDANYMKNRKELISNNIPFIGEEIDFSSLYSDRM